MSVTSLDPLDRLRRNPSEADWLSRVPGLQDETDYIAREVLLVLVREVPRFERQRERSFRARLRRVNGNRSPEFWRRRARPPCAGTADTATEALLDRLNDPASDLSVEWDRDHDRYVFGLLDGIIRPDFKGSTWAAYRRSAVEDAPVESVANELGLTRNAVVLAKARVPRRVPQEPGVLIDAPSTFPDLIQRHRAFFREGQSCRG